MARAQVARRFARWAARPVLRAGVVTDNGQPAARRARPADHRPAGHRDRDQPVARRRRGGHLRAPPGQRVSARHGAAACSGCGSTDSAGLRRRSKASASTAEPSIRNRLTALSTGLAPSRIRPYIITVSGGSEPTSISVVLKFSNDIRNEIAAAPISAGRRYGRVMVRKHRRARGAEVVGGLFQRDVKALEARGDGQRGDRDDVGQLAQHDQRQARSQKLQLQREQVVGQLAMRLANARIEMPRITPGITSGASISRRQRRLAAELRAFDQEGIGGAHQHRQQGDPTGDHDAGPDAAQQWAIGRTARRGGCRHGRRTSPA